MKKKDLDIFMPRPACDRLSSFCYQATRKRYAIETTKTLIRKVLKLPVFVVTKICGKDIFERELFDELILVPYEQYEFRVPARYDEVLTQYYGDYMKLPPEKDRVGHHEYVVYKK